MGQYWGGDVKPIILIGTFRCRLALLHRLYRQIFNGLLALKIKRLIYRGKVTPNCEAVPQSRRVLFQDLLAAILYGFAHSNGIVVAKVGSSLGIAHSASVAHHSVDDQRIANTSCDETVLQLTPVSICLNGPVGMDLDMQIKLFETGLDELDQNCDLINQVLEITLDDANNAEFTIIRYELPSD